MPQARPAAGFLNPEQVGLVAAIAARLIPGDEEEPGALEAGVVGYIDRLLSTHPGYPERTYTRGPFAEGYDPDEEEPEPEEGVIWVEEEELPRYGWQSSFPPRELYRMGLARLDELAQQRHGSPFVDLAEHEQDGLIEAIEDDEDDDVAEIFEPIGANVFFQLVHQHTLEGFLADPMYGGNRQLVGWRAVGWPGAQRAYSPQEMLQPDFHREPQALGDLHPLNPGHRHDEHDALGSVRRRHPAGPID